LSSTIARMSAWPFRSGPLRARPRREQPAVLAVHQRLMKRQERRRADRDGDFLDAPRTEEERPESAQHPVAQREIRRALTTTLRTMSCCLSKRFSASSDRTPPGPRSFTAMTARCQHREYEVPHTRISVGQTVGAVYVAQSWIQRENRKFETHSILVADYWLLRRRELSTVDLFNLNGTYSYVSGVNWRAMFALVAAVLPVIPGFVRAASTPGRASAGSWPVRLARHIRLVCDVCARALICLAFNPRRGGGDGR
jgi:hypothetical protein